MTITNSHLWSSDSAPRTTHPRPPSTHATKRYALDDAAPRTFKYPRQEGLGFDTPSWDNSMYNARTTSSRSTTTQDPRDQLPGAIRDSAYRSDQWRPFPTPSPSDTFQSQRETLGTSKAEENWKRKLPEYCRLYHEASTSSSVLGSLECPIVIDDDDDDPKTVPSSNEHLPEDTSHSTRKLPGAACRVPKAASGSAGTLELEDEEFQAIQARILKAKASRINTQSTTDRTNAPSHRTQVHDDARQSATHMTSFERRRPIQTNDKKADHAPCRDTESRFEPPRASQVEQEKTDSTIGSLDSSQQKTDSAIGSLESSQIWETTQSDAECRLAAQLAAARPKEAMITTVSPSDAAFLMQQRLRTGGLLDRVNSMPSTRLIPHTTNTTSTTTSVRPAPTPTITSIPVAPAATPARPKVRTKIHSSKKSIPLHKITDDDWKLFHLYNSGKSCKWIAENCARLSMQERTPNYISQRYARMKLTCLDSVPAQNNVQQREARNQAIEQRLRNRQGLNDLLDVPHDLDLDFGPAHPSAHHIAQLTANPTVNLTADSTANSTASPTASPTAYPTDGPGGNPTTPGCAGKKLSEDLVAYMKAMHGQDDDGEDVDSRPLREASPLTEEDFIYYEYFIERCVVSGEKVPEWVQSGHRCETLHEANTAAIAELNESLEYLDIGPLRSWSNDIDECGMATCTAASAGGRIEVRVRRIARTLEQRPVAPRAKVHWFGRRVWQVMVTRVLVEAGDGSRQPAVRETVMPVGDEVFGSRERANATAGRHYLTVVRAMDPDPRRRSLNMEEYEQRRHEDEAMERHVEGLDEGGKLFDETVQLGEDDNQDDEGDDHDDNCGGDNGREDNGDCSDGNGNGNGSNGDAGDAGGNNDGGRAHLRPSARVWVAERTLMNPRNL